MVYNADELPREGFSSQPLIDRLTERVGSNNSLDYIMRNMPQIARAVGAKRPDMMPRGAVPSPHLPQPMPNPPSMQPPQPPKLDELPDTPKGLHTPPAKMVPGANTKPGEPMSKEDVEAFNKMMSETSARRMQMQPANPYAMSTFPPQRMLPEPQVAAKPRYFRDGLGNEYKIVGDSLYVLGWQDATVKVRMVNVDTGKEIPSKGRKFQIYGWHLVKKAENTENESAPDVSRLEEEMRFSKCADETKKPEPETTTGNKDEKTPTVEEVGEESAPTVSEVQTETVVEKGVEDAVVTAETVQALPKASSAERKRKRLI